MSENHNGPGVALTPARGADLRAMREQGVVIRLPSGLVVRMRTVHPAHLLRLGNIPDVLTPLVIKTLYGEATTADLREFISLREQKEEALAVMESLRVVCTAALLEPRIVDHPQADDEIAIEDLSPSDQGWIFSLAFAEAASLASFRDRQAADVEPVAALDEHPQPAG